MSIFQIPEKEGEKKKPILDVQSKVCELQFISEKTTYPLFEFKNSFLENNCKELFSQNIMEQPKKNCSRKEINAFYSKIKYIRKKYNIKKSRKNHIDSLVKKAKSKFLKGIYEGLKYCLNSYINRLPQKFIINTKIEYLYEKKKIEKKSGYGVAQLYDFVATNICEYFLLNKGNHRNKFNNIHKKFTKKNTNINEYENRKMNVINNKNIFVKFNILKIDNDSILCKKE